MSDKTVENDPVTRKFYASMEEARKGLRELPEWVLSDTGMDDLVKDEK